MSMTGIKAAIVTALESVTTLKRVYSQVPDKINEIPCAYVLPRSGTFHMDVGGNMTHTMEAVVLVKRVADLVEGQEALDEYLDDSSIKTAIEAADLSTHAHAVIVTGYRDYGGLEYSGDVYLGLKFDIKVIA